jgi:hypothetical protein
MAYAGEAKDREQLAGSPAQRREWREIAHRQSLPPTMTAMQENEGQLPGA